MGGGSRRILAFSLGVLLLFRGVYVLMNGTEFMEEILIDLYRPLSDYEVCTPCVASIMMGSDFMGNIFKTPSARDTYSEYLVYVSYAIYLGEVVTPLLLIFGKYIRISATIIAIDLLLAMVILYKDDVFSLSASGGWHMELPLLYFVLAVTLALSGEDKKPSGVKMVRKRKKR